MIRCVSDGVISYRFASLSQYPEVLHAVFTRVGGTSGGPFAGLNIGLAVGDRPERVRANLDRVYRALGIAASQVVTARQVHGGHITVVDQHQRGSTLPDTDGLVTGQRGTALLLRFADCLPLMLYDPEQHAIALVHAGWRGVITGVVGNALSSLQRVFASNPRDLLACLGPAIGPCCYQVGDDVATEVKRAFGRKSRLLLMGGDGRVRFDLPAAVRWQLQSAGAERIEESRLCTACHTDEFFSHRAEKGRTGRFAAVLALRENRVA